MSRGMINVFLVVLGVAALSSRAWGSCSQYGHSCFGAHGKRDGDQYARQEPSPLYPEANQLPEFEQRQEDRLSVDEAVTDREIVANARNWLAVLSHRLRQRTSPQSSPSAQSLGYFQ
uniref:CChamide-2 n=1 Tax=Nephrops norvegicus TaxID=6829 RepID=A0A4D6BME1_NEPNO|nr:CChamide-2 [Nephrops norvegicus]